MANDKKQAPYPLHKSLIVKDCESNESGIARTGALATIALAFSFQYKKANHHNNQTLDGNKNSAFPMAEGKCSAPVGTEKLYA